MVGVGWMLGGLIHTRLPTLTRRGGGASACASDWFGWGQQGVFDVEIIE